MSYTSTNHSWTFVQNQAVKENQISNLCLKTDRRWFADGQTKKFVMSRPGSNKLYDRPSAQIVTISLRNNKLMCWHRMEKHNIQSIQRLGSWRAECTNGINKNVTNFEATCCYSNEMLQPSDSDGLYHCVTSKWLTGLFLNWPVYGDSEQHCRKN